MNRILIVDDSDLVRRRVASWIEGTERVVLHAASCREAREALGSDGPDLMILDLDLPDGSGLDLCRLLKSGEATNRMPVIILTASESEEHRLACLEAGADDVIVKPGSRSELGARVRSLLRAKQLSDRLLVSYHELDRLGDLAEGFVKRPVADWSRVEVARAMAHHVLDADQWSSARPRLLWAALRDGDRLVGGWWRRVGDALDEHPVEVPAAEVFSWLQRYPPGGGAHIVKGMFGAEGARAIGVPPSANQVGAVAFVREGNVLIAIGYPWEVGTYEIALLRAMHRHWEAFERIRQEALRTERAFFHTMDALALAAEFYQHGTAAHIQRVGALAGQLARLDGRDRRFVRWLTQSAKLHDVGKITIPIAVLTRQDFTPVELTRLQRHTVDGEALLTGAEHLAMARSIARHHHECWDGSGYPDGLAGDAIPYDARLVKLADVYDAIRSERSYKAAYSHNETLRILARGDERVRPEHFDPHLLELLLAHDGLIQTCYDDAPA